MPHFAIFFSCDINRSVSLTEASVFSASVPRQSTCCRQIMRERNVTLTTVPELPAMAACLAELAVCYNLILRLTSFVLFKHSNLAFR